jgi:hypothetical protein
VLIAMTEAMKKMPLSPVSLLRHKTTLERTLRDLHARMRFDHLGEDEIAQIVQSVEQRLAELNAELEIVRTIPPLSSHPRARGARAKPR